MWILWTLVVGLGLGIAARLLWTGRDAAGIYLLILLGMGGAVVGAFLGSMVGLYDRTAGGPGLVAAVLGAISMLSVYRFGTRLREG